jgi:hypothetical protein
MLTGGRSTRIRDPPRLAASGTFDIASRLPDFTQRWCSEALQASSVI